MFLKIDNNFILKSVTGSTFNQKPSVSNSPFYVHTFTIASYCCSFFKHMAIMFPVTRLFALKWEYEKVRKEDLKQLILNLITC